MKNKPLKRDGKSQQKVLNNVTKPSLNIKHRDHLRKKLKSLLEKEKPETFVKPPRSNANFTSNAAQEEYPLFNEGIHITKPRSFKQNKKNNQTSNGVQLKQKEQEIKSKNRMNILNKTKHTKIVQPADCSTKTNGSVNKQNNPSKKATKSRDSKNTDDSFETKKHKIPKKKTDKDEGSSTLKATKKGKLSEAVDNTGRPPKQNLYIQGQGPLRPQTPESEIEGDVDSSPHQRKGKNKRNIIPQSTTDDSPETIEPKETNNEQALIRAENEFTSDTYNNHNFDFLFDGTFADDSEEMSFSSEEFGEEESDFEFSDEESDFDSESETYDDDDESHDSDDYQSHTDEEYSDDYSLDYSSANDDSYQPPESYAEDVYIAQGTAVKYELANNDVGFDSDSQSAQIIEIPPEAPTENITPSIQTPLSLPNNDNNQTLQDNDINQTQLETSCKNNQSSLDSDDSCPELVAIQYSNSSSDSSHSCFSSSDCESYDEIYETSNSEDSVKPMTPEVIKANAETIDKMETFFNTNSNNTQIHPSADSIIEQIISSYESPLSAKVYTINNEILDNAIISGELPKKNNTSIEHLSEDNGQNTCESPSPKSCDEITHVNKKLRVSSPLHNELPSEISFESNVDERSSLNITKDKSNFMKSSQPKTQTRTLFFNAINCNHVLVLLKDPLYIYGTVKLKLLAGYLEVFGYNPKRNEILEVFSPRGYSSLKIEPSPSKVHVPLIEKELLSLTPFFIRSDLEEILKHFEPSQDAIVILERNDRSKKINMLRKYMVENLFPNMNSIQSDRPFYTSEFLLRCVITTSTENATVINPEWNTIPVQKNSKIMVIGGKSVGKSTLIRYLINKNLLKHPKMLLIDLDIGQPEVFIPQTVSVTSITAPLLGPAYFLNKQPDKSFLVGHINIMNCLDTYISSLKALFEYCNGNSDYKDIPWIVNTMGYNKGFGDEIVSVICSLLHPTNVVQLESDREINDFDIIMMKDNVESIERNIIEDLFNPTNDYVPQHQLTLIKAFTARSRFYGNDMSLKPRDMRLAMILSRLSGILVGHAEWMTDVKPLCASIDDLKIIKMGEDQLDKEDLIKTLVGNLVYLCHMESENAPECLGIGIVRGVDYPLRQIYLLPSISMDLLKSVNCLAICGIPLPSSLLLNQGPKVKGNASFVFNTLNEASSMYIQQMYNKPQPIPFGKRKFTSN